MQAQSQQDLVQGRLGEGCRLNRQRRPAGDQFAHAERHRSHLGLPGGHRDQRVVNSKPVSVYIYEHTIQIAVTDSNKVESVEKGLVPVQIVFE
ncbi:hypothetical protein H4582DRAFT_400745 [Lactarius indigo]|nr:hypothetical protein H4582DRAFT_400745 [Lactarius indigo]